MFNMPRLKNDSKKTKDKDFFEGTGRRKEAVARVRLFFKKGDFLLNDKPIDKYFSNIVEQKKYNEPFRVVNRQDQFSGSIKVEGGGKIGQIDAVVLGISRALAKFDESFRPILRKYKLLTRDPRVKESRHYGLAGKARKKKQSPKR